MSLNDKLAEKKAALSALEGGIKSGDAEAIASAKSLMDEIDALNDAIAVAEKSDALFASMKNDNVESNDETKVVSFKDAAEYLSRQLARTVKGQRGIAVSSPEVKTDPAVIESLSIDTFNRAVPALLRRNAVAPVFGNYEISGDSYTFLKKKALVGAISSVAEGAEKPMLETGYEKSTITINKYAGYMKYTEELVRDNAFLVSAIQNELLLELGKKEDAVIMSTVLGASGIGTATYDATEDTGMVDAILTAMSTIENTTAYDADGIFMNPADLTALLLLKKADGGYYGKDFFAGDPDQPSIWGIPVHKTSNISQGTVLVGAFKAAAKVVRNGGVSFAATNTNEDDFIHNLYTVLAEERFGVAVELPAAMIKLTANPSQG